MISVALCTYNGEKYLQEQLVSIYEQELPVDEIVICDDNSQDKTLEIAYLFRDKHPDLHITIFKNENNLGVIRNFEKAILACHGDIIFCSDQDDIWMKEKTKTIISWFNNHPGAEMVFTDATLIDKDGNPLCDSTLFDKLRFNSQARRLWKNGLALELTNIRNWVTGATIAFRKSLREIIIPFLKGTHYLHDEQIAVTCIKRGTIHLIEKKLIKYRIHENNTIGINPLFENMPIDFFRPREIRNALMLINNSDDESKKRILFLRERYDNYKTPLGRMKILFSVVKYIRYYKCLFSPFILQISQ